MKLIKRGTALTAVITSAALIAVGCGGGTGTAKTSSSALKLVPKTAIGYVVLDTDFEGKNWESAQKLSTAFSNDVDVKKDAVKSFDDSLDYEKDVKPWLGKSAGAAMLALDTDTKNKESAEGFAWVELSDRAKFEATLEKLDYKKGEKSNDYTIWTKDKNDELLGVSDDLAIAADDEAALKSITGYKGDSIEKADITKAAKEIQDNAIVSGVLNGAALVEALKKGKDTKSLADNKQLKDLKAASFSFGPDGDGFRFHTFSDGGISGAKNGKNSIFRALPEDTLFALGGQDFGDTLKTATDEAAKSDDSVQSAIGSFTGLLGIDIDELSETFSDEFVLGLSGSETGVKSLVDAAMGAAMGGGVSGLEPGKLASNAAIILAFTKGEKTQRTLEKLAGSATGLVGGAKANDGKAGDFDTKVSNVFGIPVTTATSDKIAALTIGTDVFSEWGKKSLADNGHFKDAWSAANAPKEVAFSFWTDYPRIAKLADLETNSEYVPGGWVGWGDIDKSSGSFDLFFHVKKK